MRIITISREFGSGGRELGKRLADYLGFDYYDREIITAIAQNQGLDEKYVENTLDNHGWQTIPVTFHRSFAAPMMVPNMQNQILLEQKRVIDGIAKAGMDCVIVGRNADTLLAKENPLKLFVCADMEAKIRRCIERAEPGENLARKEIEQNIRRIDKVRAQTHEMMSGNKWGERSGYHLIVNTCGWDMEDLTPAVAEFAIRWFGREK